MKAVVFVALLAINSPQALASDGNVGNSGNSSAVYRCGNEYLNDAAAAQARGCHIVESSGVTVTVTGTRVQAQVAQPAQVREPGPASTNFSSAATVTAPKAGSWRTDSAEQRARDRDALSILQAELMKAEAQLTERQRDLLGASGDKSSSADPQRHASRLADLQSSIGRHLSDIAGLKREISRLPFQAQSK